MLFPGREGEKCAIDAAFPRRPDVYSKIRS
jgi:hypothetical protein